MAITNAYQSHIQSGPKSKVGWYTYTRCVVGPPHRGSWRLIDQISEALQGHLHQAGDRHHNHTPNDLANRQSGRSNLPVLLGHQVPP